MKKPWILGVILMTALILVIIAFSKQNKVIHITDEGFLKQEELILRTNALAISGYESQLHNIENQRILLGHIGANFMSLGKWKLAGKYYEKYLLINDANFSVWMDFGHSLRRRGKIKDAEKAFLQALEIRASESSVRNLVDLWSEYMFEERKLEIKDLLEKSIQTLGQRPYFMVELGKWYLDDGNCEEAIAHFEVLTQLLPDDEGAMADLETVKQQCAEMAQSQ